MASRPVLAATAVVLASMAPAAGPIVGGLMALHAAVAAYLAVVTRDR